MSQQKDFTVLVYRDAAPPRVLRIKPFTIKFFLWLMPIAIFAVVLTGFASSVVTRYFSTQDQRLERAQLSRVENQLAQLQAEYESLKDEVGYARGIPTEVEAGLRAEPQSTVNFLPADSIAQDESPAVPVIARGFRRSVTQEGSLILDFRLENTQEELGDSIRGSVVVTATGAGVIGVYPNEAALSRGQLVDPAQGETFRFSRLRPVRARFDQLKNPNRVNSFRVYLFDEQGQPILQANWSE